MCALLSFAMASAACAAPVDCGDARHMPEQLICRHPELKALDAQLAATYAAALARAPSEKTALRKDERQWEGDRNRRMRTAEIIDRNAKAVVGDVAKMYKARIAFLKNVKRPAAVTDLPVARLLLRQAPDLPPGTDSVLHALQKKHLAQLPPEQHDFDDVSAVLAALPAPADARFRQALQAMSGAMTLVYLPQANLGGVYTVQGTAYCQRWLAFKRVGDTTERVHTPNPALNGACARDDGSVSYLALVDHHPVAVIEKISATGTDLQWRRWTGNAWTSPVRVHFRFARALSVRDSDRSLRVPSNACKNNTSSACVRESAAVASVDRYLRNPWSLLDVTQLSTSEKKRFVAMRATARKQVTRHQRDNHQLRNGFNMTAILFPVRLGDRLTVGRIVHRHFASHPEAGWHVSFLNRKSPESIVKSPGVTVVEKHGRLLTAARVPPFPSR